MSDLKCVVMGGKVFNVKVIGENENIKDGFYVRYEDGGTDTFKSHHLLERADSQELTTLSQQNAELVEFANEFKRYVPLAIDGNHLKVSRIEKLLSKIKGDKDA